eukprot:9256186-Pyramimonas_sp.AAC.1
MEPRHPPPPPALAMPWSPAPGDAMARHRAVPWSPAPGDAAQSSASGAAGHMPAGPRAKRA